MPNDLQQSILITSIDGRTFDLADPASIQNHGARINEYTNIGQQLNYLYDDIQAGVFGDAAKSGRFAQYLKSIKDKYPVVKPGLTKDS